MLGLQSKYWSSHDKDFWLTRNQDPTRMLVEGRTLPEAGFYSIWFHFFFSFFPGVFTSRINSRGSGRAGPGITGDPTRSVRV